MTDPMVGLFDELAGVYDTVLPFFAAFGEQTAAFLPPGGGRLLDVGPGAGWYATHGSRLFLDALDDTRRAEFRRRVAVGRERVLRRAALLYRAVTPPLVVDRYPRLAAQLVTQLRAAGELTLAERVAELRVVQECGCGDDFCHSFYTAPPPDGPYGRGHRNVWLPQMLVLDVVDDRIEYVEITDSRPLV